MTPDLCTASQASPPANPWRWPALATIEQTLPNGLRVVLASDRTVPLVIVSWTSPAGFDADPAGHEGLASFTPPLLREGTARRSGREITRALDELGGRFWSGADWSTAFLNVGVLSCDFAPAADLLLDMACAPRFPDAAVAHLRRRRLLELARRARDPRAIASDAFARAMFSEAGYGRPSLGTPETVQRFDRDTIAAFHAERYQPSTSCVAVAGSFDADVVLDLLGAFTIPSAGRGRRPPSPAVVVQPSPDVRVMDVPGATQTEIRIGQAVPVTGELVSPLEVLNAVLGDELTGRLARTVRYRLGLTYYIRSRIIARRLGSVFVVETSVANGTAAAALAAIYGEIERLRDGLVPRDELERAKRRLVGAELRYMQDLTAVGASLGPVALRDNPGFVTRRTQAIASATPEDLRELARRYLRPDRLVTVVAGPAVLLPSQFSSGASAPLDSVS